MRYFLLLFLLSSSLYADEQAYLKISSVAAYPKPGQGVERTIDIVIAPQFPEDSAFDEIFNELIQISKDPASKIAPLHVRFISYEAKKNGKSVKVIYWGDSTKDNEHLRAHWNHIFELAREISNEQLNP